MTGVGSSGESAPLLVGDDGSLALAARTDGLLSAAAAGALVGVSDQTIRNWHKAGLASAGKSLRGDPLFHGETVIRWRRENRPENRKGGKRPGVGRKRKSGEQRLEEGKAKGQTTLDDAVTEAGNAPPAVPDPKALEVQAARRRYIVGEETPADMELLHNAVAGLTRADSDARHEHFKSELAKTELRRRTGELRDAEEVRATWSAFLALLAAKLSALPGKAAMELGAVLKLDTVAVLEAREKIEEVVAGLQREIVEACSGPSRSDGVQSLAA